MLALPQFQTKGLKIPERCYVLDTKRAAVVTGGAAGIGLEIVRHLLGEGMSVVAIDRDVTACARAQQTIGREQERLRIVTGDIGTLDGARRRFKPRSTSMGVWICSATMRLCIH